MMERTQILVVDDDAQVRRSISRLLERDGFGVTSVADGYAALEEAERIRPSLAIVDLMMPLMDGFEVVRSLKERFGASLHTTVLSATNDEVSRIQAFDAGADDFVAKPADLTEFRKRIASAHRLQQAIETAREATEKAERLLVYSAEAAALLAHDLNNGFCVVIGHLDFVSQFGIECNDGKDSLDAALRAARRLAGFTANFVDISRLEEGVLEPHKSPCNINGLIREAVEIHSKGVPEAGTTFEIDLNCDFEANVDGALLERVIHNLVGNAQRYCGDGGTIRVRASAIRGESPESSYFTLEVENTGERVPDSIREKLFDKYTKGQGKTGMRGMGLYFCRLVCESHGGTIALDPESDLTRFVVTLPFSS